MALRPVDGPAVAAGEGRLRAVAALESRPDFRGPDPEEGDKGGGAPRAPDAVGDDLREEDEEDGPRGEAAEAGEEVPLLEEVEVRWGHQAAERVEQAGGEDVEPPAAPSVADAAPCTSPGAVAAAWPRPASSAASPRGSRVAAPFGAEGRRSGPPCARTPHQGRHRQQQLPREPHFRRRLGPRGAAAAATGAALQLEPDGLDAAAGSRSGGWRAGEEVERPAPPPAPGASSGSSGNPREDAPAAAASPRAFAGAAAVAAFWPALPRHGGRRPRRVSSRPSWDRA